MLKEVLLGNFENGIKSMKCPSCDDGMLLVNQELHKRFPTAYSLKKNTALLNSWEPEFQAIFSDFFHCNNPTCNEAAILTGIIDAITVFESDEENGTEYPYYQYKITITHIEPAINLFTVPKELPEALRRELRKSFYVFWSDNDASANKLRIFVERLLDTLQIPPHKTLHSRIKNYLQGSSNTKLVGLGNKLMAIKWIGNQGSHSDIGLTSENIVVAFEILENVLNKIYNNSEKLINKKVTKINKNQKI